MLYTPENALGSTVHDIETGSQLKRVVSVDAEAGIITMCHDPLRFDRSRGVIETFQARFARVYSIWDQGRPVLFHCYGRLQ